MAGKYEIWLTDDRGMRLADRDGNTFLDEVHSLKCTRIVNGIGWCQLVVPRFFDPTLIRPDYMIQVWRQPQGGTLSLWRVYFLRKWRFQTDGGEQTIVLEGPGSNDLLRRRIVAAYAGTSWASKSDYADDLMKEIVTENTQAVADLLQPLPSAGTRQWDDISVAADTSDGPTLTKSFAWSKLLTWAGGGALANVARAAREAGTEVFFDVVADNVSSSAISFEFRTYIGQPGADRTDTVFDQARGNLEDPFLEYDYSTEENYIYAGGQGEGTARNVQQVYDADRYGLSQWNRCEGFIDAMDCTSDNCVREAGRAELEKGRPRLLFSGKPLDVAGTRFGVHWEHGDKVTAHYLNQEFECIIRATAIEVDEDGEEEIGARLEYESDV